MAEKEPEFTTMRVPTAVWERVKIVAPSLKYSASQLANAFIEDCVAVAESNSPSVPKVIELLHFAKQQGLRKKGK